MRGGLVTHLENGASLGAQAVATLVRQATCGDEAAWGSLVGRYVGLAWAVIDCYGLSAEDAAAASRRAWMRTAQGLRTLTEPDLFASQLVRAAKKECLRTRRRASSRGPANPRARTTGPRGRADLWGALATLPAPSQVLLSLAAVEPLLSDEQIAAATGMRVCSVDPARRRCLIKLQEAQHHVRSRASSPP
jgi:DNA-directed RNA polymerase specialized sigma24 family protein